MAILTSLPHLLLAALYLITNSILTTYFLSHESSRFAVLPGCPHRPLRVSGNHPEGEQTGSLYLTLPRPVSWFLVVLFAGMGFVLSQSVFAVEMALLREARAAPPISTTDSTTAMIPLTKTTTATTKTTVVLTALGLSGVGLLALLALLVLLGAVVVGLGFRTAPAAAAGTPVTGQAGLAVGNPMAMPAGSCSAVISARCHAARQRGNLNRAARRGSLLWRRPLAWGVVNDSEGTSMRVVGADDAVGVSHCGFTAGVPGRVDVARRYA